MRSPTAIAEWVVECQREASAFGFKLRSLTISEKNEEAVIAPLLFASPPLSDKVFTMEQDAEKPAKITFLGVRLRFSKVLPEGKFWMSWEKDQ